MTAIARNKSFRALIALAITAAVLAPFALRDARADGHEDSPIMKAMEEINNEYKYLRREARRLKFTDETVERVVKMQENALKAMHMSFPVAEKAGDKKAAVMLSYKKQMAVTIKSMLDLEIALLEDRKEDAKKIIDELGKHKSAGHEEFVEE